MAPAGWNNCRFRIDIGGRPSVAAVCVSRMNFARTGENAIAVKPPVPSPWATGALHVVPSIDVVTW